MKTKARAGMTRKRKRNPNDATLRNIRAAEHRLGNLMDISRRLDRNISELTRRVLDLEAHIGRDLVKR